MKYILFIIYIFASSTTFAQENHLQDEAINELSGLAVSSKNDNLIWVHNDSGDKSYVYLINNQGKKLARINYNKEVKDCEDIALFTPKNQKPQIYVADIGDNNAKRDYISLYKFDEPNSDINDTDFDIKNVEEIKLKYPDGPRDSECLIIDPIDKNIYIISKREDSVKVYSTPINTRSNQNTTLKKEATLFFPGFVKLKFITSGDISRDGKQIVIKSYGNIFYWERKANETFVNALKKPFKILPYKPEPQGEAIGFTHSGNKYYTISEGKGAIIYLKSIN
ncbi:hypothetical protein A5893_00060 [Pedobacter psychrophilus]|uniref:PE-PGRS family protein n=1 Tax=Pedobacter psychrophilus TaxID=1826909 RepID=A0A179DK93_9SPHI|nr:hypothetical protein [Pedobacter psychrophilus]OAQ41546.1 hypothetical protein A5893_00060 [Pedobacter psychrophilus]